MKSTLGTWFSCASRELAGARCCGSCRSRVWRWRDETIRELPALRALAAEDLHSTVLRLSFDIEVDLRERDEIERILDDLDGNEARHGRVGVFDADRAGIRIRITSVTGAFPPNLPPVLQAVVDSLQGIASLLHSSMHTDMSTVGPSCATVRRSGRWR